MNIKDGVNKNKSFLSNILQQTFPSAKNSMSPLGEFDFEKMNSDNVHQITGEVSPEKFKKSMDNAIKL